jgi:acetyltransferase-like isoleucine patch superfamily enzyme
MAPTVYEATADWGIFEPSVPLSAPASLGQPLVELPQEKVFSYNSNPLLNLKVFAPANISLGPLIRLQQIGPNNEQKDLTAVLLAVPARFEILLAGPGNKLFVGDVNDFGGSFVLWKNCVVAIGDKASSNQTSATANQNHIIIGRDCMFAHEVMLQAANMHTIVDLKTKKTSTTLLTKQIIGPHVRLGRRTLLLPGVTVGAGSIIAAGAVVAKNIPHSSLAAGVPAKIIKQQVSWFRNNDGRYQEHELQDLPAPLPSFAGE